MRETWKQIDGWEGLYEVSDRGRIRSVDRIASDGRRVKGRILKTPLAGNGYPRCNLHRGGLKTHVTVHLIVAKAFLGECPAGEEVRHRDGNRTNARASNLRYGTRSQNHMDKIDHGTMARGELCGTAKLTNRRVRSIRRRYAAGNISQQKLGEEYGVTQATIGRAIRGDCWGWL